MYFTFLNQPGYQKFIQAVCLAFIHSIWQGMLLAILTGLVLMFSARSRPVVRYNLFCFLLLLFFGVNGYTFYSLYADAAESVSAAPAVSKPAIFPHSQHDILAGYLPQQSFLMEIIQRTMQWCNGHSAWIVSLWLVVFLVKTIKAGTGLVYVNRITRSKTHAADVAWLERLEVLKHRLGISRNIVLLESEIVTVPMVAGFLKPVILLPIALVSHLPVSQVEAILLHELAHIRREDYFINLVQTFLENIFFFNPAVLWLSDLIRQEREHCCDDLAVSQMENKSVLVNALVGFQEYNLTTHQAALAFPGSRMGKTGNHLLIRIKRIIYNNNKSLNAMEKLFVIASLLVAAMLPVAISPSQQSAEPRNVIAATIKPITAQLAVDVVPRYLHDTLPKRGVTRYGDKSTYEITREDKHYEIEEINGKITSLTIDGKQIAKDKIETYDKEITPILEDIKIHQKEAEAHRFEAEQRREEAETHRIEAEKFRAEADQLRENAEVQRQRAEEYRIQADDMKMAAEDMRKSIEKESIRSQKFREEAALLRIKAEDSRKHAEQAQKYAEVIRLQAEEHRGIAEIHRKEAERHRIQAEKDRVVYEKMQEELIQYLVKEGIVKDRNNVSYKLNNDELIVNGVKQPAAIHQKFKARFVKDNTVEILYNYNGKRGYTSGSTSYSR